MLDIHALQVFYEASKTQNFTAAARVLNMSQPAVSMQIKTLEEYLQAPLFERYGRRMRLTKAGEALAPMAQQIIQMAINAEETIRDSNGNVVGNLTIASSAPSANYLLPHVIARFQRMYPQVKVSMPVLGQREMQAQLLRGHYDFGVVGVPDDYCQQLVCTPFFNDRIVLIAPVNHPWADKRRISAPELLTGRFICQDEHSACRKTVGTALDGFGIEVNQLKVVMEMGDQEAIVAAVEHGLGVSFVSMMTAAPRLALGRLAIVEVEDLQLSAKVYIAFSKAYAGAPVQTRFRAFLDHPQTQSLIGLVAEGRLM